MSKAEEHLIPATHQRARIVPMIGDSMEPALRNGDAALAVPVQRFKHDGLYVLSVLPECMDIYRCQHVGRRQIRIYKDNPKYSAYTVTAEAFEEMVLAQVVATAHVIERELLWPAAAVG